MATDDEIKQFQQRLKAAPCLLVEKTKHEEKYWLIRNGDDLAAAALQILDRRIKDRGITEPAAEPYGILDGELPEDAMAALPEPYQATARQVARRNRITRRDHERTVELWHRTQRALAARDGITAWTVIDDRSDHEYEGLQFRRINVPT